jgi:hypothetical protein
MQLLLAVHPSQPPFSPSAKRSDDRGNGQVWVR